MSFEPFRVAVAVYGILRDEDRVLLMRRQGTGFRDGEWSLPSGHIDGGEDVGAALVRELREELAIEADPEDCALALALHAAPEFDGDAEYLHLFFHVGAWSGQPRIAEPHKCGELAWWERSTLPPDLVDYVGDAFTAIDRDEALLLRGW